MEDIGFFYSVRPRAPRRPACKFLVPRHLRSLLERRLRRFDQRMLLYLPRLIRLAREAPHGLPRRGHFTTLYQEPALDLQPFNFRVRGEDWGEFKTLARGLGVSMCRLFVALLLLESSSEKEKNEGSTTFRLFLSERIAPGKKRLLRRLRIRPQRRKPR